MEILIASVLLLNVIILYNIGCEIREYLKRITYSLESIAIDTENIDSLLVQFKGKNNDA